MYKSQSLFITMKREKQIGVFRGLLFAVDLNLEEKEDGYV